MVNLGKKRDFEKVSVTGCHFRNFRHPAEGKKKVSFAGAGDITHIIDPFEY